MKKILFALGLSLTFLSATALEVNKSTLKEFNSFEYETPLGRQMKISKKTELIIVAFEKDTGKLVNSYLKEQDPFYMPKRHVVYIADIHNMPSIITNMFALPKLQKYKHPIYLHYDEEFEKFVPNEEEKVTLIRFGDGIVISVEYITTAEELKVAIEK